MFHDCFVCKYYWAIKYVKTNIPVYYSIYTKLQNNSNSYIKKTHTKTHLIWNKVPKNLIFLHLIYGFRFYASLKYCALKPNCINALVKGMQKFT